MSIYRLAQYADLGEITHEPEKLSGGALYNWTAFNIQRMLGNTSKNQYEINLGKRLKLHFYKS